MNFNFSSNQRVKQSKDFEIAFRRKGLANKWFTIHVANSQHEFARLGLVISKRVIAKSVYRNRAKRLIREIFRNNALSLPPMDFIVRIRRNLTDECCKEAQQALLKLMLSTNTI